MAIALAALGVAVALTLLAPLMDGVERRIRARIHSRIGPPILQTYYDLAKLFRKEAVASVGSAQQLLQGFLGSLACSVAALAAVAASILAPGPWLALAPPLLACSTASLVVAVSSTANPFSLTGASRELILALVNEAALAVSIALLAWLAPSLSVAGLGEAARGTPLAYTLLAIVVAVSCYVASMRLPFDLAEAEPELATGVLVEAGGPILAFAELSLLTRRMFCSALTSLLLVAPTPAPLPLLLLVPMALVVWAVHALVAPLLARSRIDLAPKSLLAFYTLVLVAGVAAGALGV